jgi:hypothetical protein
MSRWVAAARSRWLTLGLIALVVVVAAVQLGNPHSYVSEAVSRLGETRSGPDAALTDLTRVGQLRSAFNNDSGHPRLILLLSPT